MRSYGIYKVKKSYEPFVIGREQIFYDLLKKNSDQTVNLREVKYLCDLLERQAINEAIITKLGKVFTTIECENEVYRLTHPVKGSILISLADYSMTVYCRGSRMLDLDLFVALSEVGNRFFAIMEERGEWGWLKPIKHSEMQEKNEVVL